MTEDIFEAVLFDQEKRCFQGRIDLSFGKDVPAGRFALVLVGRLDDFRVGELPPEPGSPSSKTSL